MEDHLEDLILTEARRQGIQPNADAMRKAAIDLAGSVMTSDGLIALPGRGSITTADFVRSLQKQMPEAFGTLNEGKPAIKPSGNLTADMKAELESSRRKQSMPADWGSVRARYSPDSLTARYMEELAASRPGKQGTRK
ncbi:hypothetical protein [Bradyrhizobium paxllaeri]|uniref:hypothetical protein n=1 Tax=Bradyrhizobium paxllaeri TaxID=190148 RepID=UPI0008107223|nr:hypothetical protein [Bradyrhizobium paxllaeri]